MPPSPFIPLASGNKGLSGLPRLLPWPKRLDVSLLCFLGLFVATCDRANISVAAPSMMKEYGWDITTMGWVLSTFYVGYMGFMIPAGVLADRFGPKRIFALAMASWSSFTALTSLPRSLGVLGIVRTFMGIGESATIPSINAILARWFPPEEYSRTAGFTWSGGYGGIILAFPLASLILKFLGWRMIFYLFATLGGLWLIFWLKAIYDQPEDCPTISRAEMELIRSSRPQIKGDEPIPWSVILHTPEAWAVFALHFSSNWFTYFLMSWLPTYLVIGRHFSLRQMALGSALPFLCALCGTNLFGYLIDRVSRSSSRTHVNKTFLLPFACAAGILIVISKVSSSSVVVPLLCISATLMTSATPVFASGSLDLVPGSAGSFVGVQNSIANLSGVLAPVITGYLATSTGWMAAFSCTAAVCAFGITCYWLMGKAERRPPSPRGPINFSSFEISSIGPEFVD
ncbi:MAG TPA: MFS transporter [Candidatus Angelobacter sp.]|nr:MFS transporter [Candidatus Angelobacter sp.]